MSCPLILPPLQTSPKPYVTINLLRIPVDRDLAVHSSVVYYRPHHAILKHGSNHIYIIYHIMILPIGNENSPRGEAGELTEMSF